ncbi:MAG: sulfurtransferase [Candidatus Dormibacteraceae bacterium]
MPDRACRPGWMVLVGLAALLLSVAACYGCGSATGSVRTPTALLPHPPTLAVDAQSVPEIIAVHHPLLLSVQSKLEIGPSGFLKGAVAVNEDEWTADSSNQAQLDDLSMWQRLVGELGITDGRTVLVYDDGELKFASRVRFLLSHYGVTRAQLVNGGWPALEQLQAQGKLATQPSPVEPVPGHFTVHVTDQPIPLITRAEVEADVHRRVVRLVDVRSPQEYNGTDLLPPVTRGGHIPGAINLPETQLFVSGQPNLLMDEAGLRKLFAAHHLTAGDKIVVYCQNGARSSLVATMLKQSGYPSVGLYYLSYVDWQSDPNLPVVRS